MSEAESCGVGESIREIWQIDKKRLKDEFDEDQKKNCKIYKHLIMFTILYI